MILCLDIGNTQVFGGIFQEETLILRFRFDSRTLFTSDQFGIFLRSVLRENAISHQDIQEVALCSVVPHLDYTVDAACQKYLDCQTFRLEAGVRTGLKIKYRNPIEVGADRIANAVAAINRYPNRNLIIIDFGTATTLCVINSTKEYLGGVIMPGIRLSMEALQQKTAKLSSVNIIEPLTVVGRSTMESIQSGLYYSQLGAIERLIREINREYFQGMAPVVIGTGGFAHLFQNQDLFQEHLPELVLDGLRLTLLLNHVS